MTDAPLPEMPLVRSKKRRGRRGKMGMWGKMGRRWNTVFQR